MDRESADSFSPQPNRCETVVTSPHAGSEKGRKRGGGNIGAIFRLFCFGTKVLGTVFVQKYALVPRLLLHCKISKTLFYEIKNSLILDYFFASIQRVHCTHGWLRRKFPTYSTRQLVVFKAEGEEHFYPLHMHLTGAIKL